MKKGKKLYIKTFLLLSFILVIGVVFWKYAHIPERLESFFEGNPRFRFIKPGLGDTLIAGEFYNVTWSSGYKDTVNILLVNNYDTTFLTKKGIPLKLGKYEWKVKDNNVGDSIKLRINVVGKSDSNSFGYVESPFFNIIKNNKGFYAEKDAKENLVKITLNYSTPIKELLDKLPKDTESTHEIVLRGKDLRSFLQILKNEDSLRIIII